nr:transposase [Mesomycoplasma ovipneumoniae]
MKKQQKTLSPFELEAKKLVDKYADYKKIKKEDFHNEISHMFKTFYWGNLRAELSQHLGYEKSNRSKKGVNRPNKRNGFSGKTVNFNSNNFHLKIPRDRNGTFENKLLGKYETNLGDIEEQVFSLFASGMSYENIVNTIKSIYKKEISNAWIFLSYWQIIAWNWKVKIAKNWQFLSNFCTLMGCFLMLKKTVFLSKNHFILFLQLIGREIKKHWDFGLKIPNQQVIDLMFFSELKTRGLEDVLIISCDNLSGISQAIEAVFRKQMFKNVLFTKLETRFLKVSNKDKKEFVLDMKKIYQAPNQEFAMQNLDKLRKNEVKNILQLSSLGIQISLN